MTFDSITLLMQILSIILLEESTTGMVVLDMCTNFQNKYQEASIQLVSPGYGKSEYPPNSLCNCIISTIESTHRPKSLNITIEDLSLENCSAVKSVEFDTLAITTRHDFQDLYQTFTLCGSNLSKVLNLRTPNPIHSYGSGRTIYSLAHIDIEFKSDEKTQSRGFKLTVTSHRGIKIGCQGTNGPITTGVPNLIPVATSSNKPENAGEEAKRRRDIIIGSIFSVLIFLAVLVVLAVFLFRRKKFLQKLPFRRSEEKVQAIDRPHPNGAQVPLVSNIDENTIVNDEYLHSRNNADRQSMPIYANPGALYENENGPRRISEDEQYIAGYIIPGNPCAKSDDRSVELQELKKPVADKVPLATPRTKVFPPLSQENSHSEGSIPLLAEEQKRPIPASRSQDHLDMGESKPSETKRKSLKLPGLSIKPKKPSIKLRSKAKPTVAQEGKKTPPPPPAQDGKKVPPPPPAKPGKFAIAKNASEDAFEVVKLQTVT